MSKETVVGVVTEVSSKAVGARKSLIYSFQIEGDKRYFKTDFTKPSITQGNYIEFETEKDQYGWKVDPARIKVKEGSPPVQDASAARFSPKSTGTDWAAKDKYDKEVRQRLIMLQSCTSAAVNIAVAALAANILPTGTGKKELKWETTLRCVNEVKRELYQDLLAAEERLVKGLPVYDSVEAVRAIEEVEDDSWSS